MKRVNLVLLLSVGLAGLLNLWLWHRRNLLQKELISQERKAQELKTKIEQTAEEQGIVERITSPFSCPPVSDNPNPQVCLCPPVALAAPEQISCDEIQSVLFQKTLKRIQEACEHPKNEQERSKNCSLLGYIYLDGIPDVLQEDIQKGLELVERYCTQDCSSLARFYQIGTIPSIQQDSQKALMLYKRSCEAKNDRACAEVAHLYQGTDQIPKDPQKEAEYMLAACLAFPPPPRQGAFLECEWVAKHYIKQMPGVTPSYGN